MRESKNHGSCGFLFISDADQDSGGEHTLLLWRRAYFII